MLGSMNCVYETPCGWCSKWDKKCDMKIPERGQRVNVSPVDDAMANKACVSEEDHEWECCGVSTKGMEYVCKKCGKHSMREW